MSQHPLVKLSLHVFVGLNSLDCSPRSIMGSSTSSGCATFFQEEPAANEAEFDPEFEFDLANLTAPPPSTPPRSHAQGPGSGSGYNHGGASPTSSSSSSPASSSSSSGARLRSAASIATQIKKRAKATTQAVSERARCARAAHSNRRSHTNSSDLSADANSPRSPDSDKKVTATDNNSLRNSSSTSRWASAVTQSPKSSQQMRERASVQKSGANANHAHEDTTVLDSQRGEYLRPWTKPSNSGSRRQLSKKFGRMKKRLSLRRRGGTCTYHYVMSLVF